VICGHPSDTDPVGDCLCQCDDFSIVGPLSAAMIGLGRERTARAYHVSTKLRAVRVGTLPKVTTSLFEL
jgi:hypothetical protein